MSTLANPSAFDQIAGAIQTVFDTEFADEGFTMIRDRLHESLGRTRVDVGIAPEYDMPMERNAIVRETWVEVRFYDLWTPEISPETVVDPTKITVYAERLQSALRRARAMDPGTDEVWYFDVRRVNYPTDPTGNHTRFHALIRAYGNNAALIETGS